MNVFSLCSCVYLCLYSGGFAAVIYTDSIQTLIIVGGAFSLMFIGGAGHSSTTIPNILFFKTLIKPDLLQCFFLPPPAFSRVGWYEGLVEQYMSATPTVTIPNTTCHLPRSDSFHMFRDPLTGDLPWPGLVFGLTILATWVWCTDQVIFNIYCFTAVDINTGHVFTFVCVLMCMSMCMLVCRL